MRMDYMPEGGQEGALSMGWPSALITSSKASSLSLEMPRAFHPDLAADGAGLQLSL